jgi:hypothetical protein
MHLSAVIVSAYFHSRHDFQLAAAEVAGRANGINGIVVGDRDRSEVALTRNCNHLLGCVIPIACGGVDVQVSSLRTIEGRETTGNGGED